MGSTTKAPTKTTTTTSPPSTTRSPPSLTTKAPTKTTTKTSPPSITMSPPSSTTKAPTKTTTKTSPPSTTTTSPPSLTTKATTKTTKISPPTTTRSPPSSTTKAPTKTTTTPQSITTTTATSPAATQTTTKPTTTTTTKPTTTTTSPIQQTSSLVPTTSKGSIVSSLTLDLNPTYSASSEWSKGWSADKAATAGGYWCSRRDPTTPVYWWLSIGDVEEEIVKIAFEEEEFPLATDAQEPPRAQFEFFASEAKACTRNGRKLISGTRDEINEKIFANGRRYHCYGLKITNLPTKPTTTT